MSESPAPSLSTPLAGLHRRLGAVPAAAGAAAAVAHYGSPTAEHAALAGACGLLDGSPLDRLRLTGDDRLRFLNGLVTCNVKELTPGAGAYGFFTTVKGRVMADFVVMAEDDALLLELPPGRGAEVAAHLGKYKIADRVELASADERLPLTVAGPRADDALAAVGLAEPPAVAWASAPATVAGIGVLAVRRAPAGVPAVTLWVPVAAAAELAETLLDEATAAGLVAVGALAADTLRVEAGVPRFGVDFGPEHFPQETGLEAAAVSYEKGCYLGQEVVARIHYRGGVNRALCGLRLTLEEGQEAPGTGAEVLHDDRAAGTLGSVVRSPELEQWIALAVLHRRAAEAGTAVAIGGVSAEVVELPFV